MGRRTSRCRYPSALVGLAIAASLVLGLAGSAAAGGPTSVLLVVPGEGRTASLYTGSADYQRLADLVGAFSVTCGDAPRSSPPEGGGDDGPAGTTHESGPGVTLTWLMHDVSVWRIDRVYLDADGGPWISTQGDVGSEIDWTKHPTWHRSSDGKALTALLDRLGVGTTAARSAVAAPAPTLTAEAVAARTSTGHVTPAAGSSADAWMAGIGGVVLGVAITLLWGALGRNRLRRSA
jgi:hypothetical protein